MAVIARAKAGAFGLRHLPRRIFNVAHLVTDAKAAEVLRALSPRLGLELTPALPAVGAWSDDPFDDGDDDGDVTVGGDGYVLAGGVAVISVLGMIVKRASGLEAACGLCGTETLQATIAAALADDRAHTLLVQIDSDGGEVAGVPDLAAFLYQARGQKRLVAQADEFALSAAYWIAAACDEVVLPVTGALGSIGALAVFCDQSGADQQDGLDFTLVTSAPKKALLNPHAPLSADGRAMMQDEVDRVAGLFIDAVATYRGLNRDVVAGFQAGVLRGPAAVQAGLGDRVDTFTNTLARLQATPPTRGAVPAPSTIVTAPKASALQPGGRMKLEGTVKTEAGEVIDLDAAREKLRGEARAELAVRARTITDLCAIAGKPELAGGYIADETLTVDGVREKLVALRAAAQDRTGGVTSRVLPEGAGEEDVPGARLRAKCKARAERARAQFAAGAAAGGR